MRDSHHPVTIKTSPPSLDGAIERERLVNALAKLPAAAKWLQSPSGTGKSTLAASYARSRKKPLIWYRLDERDNDPAFFYMEFAQAARTQLRLTPQLPIFSSDDHDRQDDFARRFATALSEQVEVPALIVLDDVQRITTEEMQRALAAMVEVAATHNELLLVSESIAPSVFFNAITARQLAVLNDADLRFDLDECKAMTAALRVDETQSESIAIFTGGHAGALVLACELLRGTDPQSALGVETVERIHLHLLTKLVEHMPEPRRTLLLQTAFVTQLTRPIAETMAGTAAARELDVLVECGVLRRVGEGRTEAFESHGLVRMGMQTLARARLGQIHAVALAQRTADVLIENTQLEAAFELLIQIGATSRATGVLEELAERYAASGQTDLLLSSITKLSLIEVQSNAWLCFWAGQSMLRIDEEQARVWFENSYKAFEVSTDTCGMRLAAASMVTAFGLEWGDLRELDNWIDRHRKAGGDLPIATIDRFEASLIMGIMWTAFISGRYPPTLDADALVTRLQQLLDVSEAWLSDDQRTQAARILIEHARIFGSYEQARGFITSARSLMDDAVGGALHRGRWLIAAAYAHFGDAAAVESAAYLHEARLLAENSQSSRLSFELGFAFADYWMKAHDLQRASDELSLLEPVATRAAPAQRAEYARMMARLLLLQERVAEGLRWAEEAKRLAVPAGFSGANLRMFEIELIYALTANDRLAEAVDLASRQEFDLAEVQVAIENCLRFLLDTKSNVESLRAGLRAAARIGFFNLLERARAPLARICEAALAHNIETEFVLRVIAVKQLVPPPLAGEHWPWPVRVKTLGGFKLDIRGKRYRPTRKAQDKPLELLKLLVTCQTLGRESAEKEWIAERLWPDAESSNARKSLDMTVARLRHLLGNDEAIASNDGRLRLSSTQVWTDVTALRRAVSHARATRDEYAVNSAAATSEAAASITAVLEHYRGSYLTDEDGPAWLLAGKEAIAATVRHALMAADAMLDGRADAMLIPALERALAADPTSEDLARALMRGHLRQDHNSEAVRVYKRLREMLSLLLGVAPSVESDHIRDQAYANQTSKSSSPAR